MRMREIMAWGDKGIVRAGGVQVEARADYEKVCGDAGGSEALKLILMFMNIY